MSAESQPGSGSSRRGFLKVATAAIGAAMAAVAGVPLVRFFLHPVGRKTVDSAAEPVEVGAAAELSPGAPPKKVEIVAARVRDGWGVRENVVVGAAWLSRDEAGELRAFTTVCPHLGCSIGYDAEAGEYRCPCHQSAFGPGGDKKSGPSKRGLDPLPVKVDEGGRVWVTYRRFRPDVAEREPV